MMMPNAKQLPFYLIMATRINSLAAKRPTNPSEDQLKPEDPFMAAIARLNRDVILGLNPQALSVVVANCNLVAKTDEALLADKVPIKLRTDPECLTGELLRASRFHRMSQDLYELFLEAGREALGTTHVVIMFRGDDLTFYAARACPFRTTLDRIDKARVDGALSFVEPI